ncbi:MAG: two-component sensor histidine kinase, partial [Ignavibacteriaceae bacterium]|nr:two-component sensor histidine kinase [Ignavibacteriaceae bacterium]
NQLSVNKVKIVKQLGSELPKIAVDANQIQQVFINLFVNALDAIGKNGGTITVTTKQISLSPFGVAQVKKATCPKRHSLIDSEFKIDGLPSLKVKVVSNGKEGLIHFDPVYGRHHNQFNLGFKIDKDSKFVCPECNISLVKQGVQCPICASPVLALEVSGQGVYEVCSSENSNWERWEFVDSSGLKEYLEIKIQDTGSGISKEDLPKIFEPFFSTKGQKGTGLGLAVIWGIIDNHNGTINVESELGKGTKFTIRLPLQEQK